MTSMASLVKRGILNCLAAASAFETVGLETMTGVTPGALEIASKCTSPMRPIPGISRYSETWKNDVSKVRKVKVTFANFHDVPKTHRSLRREYWVLWIHFLYSWRELLRRGFAKLLRTWVPPQKWIATPRIHRHCPPQEGG
jgi:hypothetical protein